MNKVILMGRLTKDVNLTYSQGEKSIAVARFMLAVDRKFKQDGQPTADFINCVSFGKTAEAIEKYCTKGTKICVEGSWQTGNYTDKNGNKVYTNDCNVASFEFCESKGSNSTDNADSRPKSNMDFMSIPSNIEADLPFE